MMKSKDKAALLKKSKKVDSDARKAIVIHEKQSKIDEDKINKTYQEKDVYLKMATK